MEVSVHPEANKKYLWNRLVEYHNMSYEEYDMESWCGTFTDTRRTSKHWDIIHHCHYLVTKLWELNPDNELKDTVKLLEGSRRWSGEFMYESHLWSPWYRPTVSKPRRRFYWRGYRDEVTKYRRLPHHQKKVLNEHEEHKKAWKTKKEGKKHKNGCHRHHKPCKYYKKLENAKRRTWEKRCLSHGDVYLDTDWKRKRVDPWCWN